MAKVVVAKVGEIADGDGKLVVAGGRPIAVFREGETYSAIDDRCPHMGASLAGGFVEAGVVTCPWHYWRFRLCDGAWADNPRIKIDCFPVSIDGGVISVDVPDPVA